MGLFDQVVNALNNPSQQASQDQLSTILGTVQHLTQSQNVSPSTTQTLLSVLGRHVRSALQEKRSAGGAAQVEDLVNRYSGTGANPQAVQSIFTPQQQRQTISDTAQATGLDANLIQSLLPVLIPVVLNLLQSGAHNQQRQGTRQGTTNSVLSAFLDSDRDGDVDIGDAMSVAGQFLQSRR